MRYELMRPKQIREAIEKRTPVVLPLGVLEYHSEHLPVGMAQLLRPWRSTGNGHTDNEKPLESLVSSFQRSRYLLYSDGRLHLCRPVRFSI